MLNILHKMAQICLIYCTKKHLSRKKKEGKTRQGAYAYYNCQYNTIYNYPYLSSLYIKELKVVIYLTNHKICI